jgi:hypothetical protein
MDTIAAPTVPTGQNVGLLLRLTFTRNECDRPHRLEAIFQDIDGERLATIQAVITPEWNEDLPVGWPAGFLWGLNFGLPLPRYSVYAMELLVAGEPIPAPKGRESLSLAVICLQIGHFSGDSGGDSEGMIVPAGAALA